jgi:hypothetical protein
VTISTESYAPPSDGDAWGTLSPGEAGFDAARLAAAIGFAQANESSWPRSLYYPDGAMSGSSNGTRADPGAISRARSGNAAGRPD